MDKQLVISFKTILLFFLVVICGYVIFSLRSVIALLLISLLIVVGVEPLVKYFSKAILFNSPLPRGFAVLLTYFLVIVFLIFVFTVGLPPVIIQAQKLIIGLGPMLENLNIGYQFTFSVKDIMPQISAFSGNLLSFVVSIFSNIATILTVLVLSVYLSLDWLNIKSGLFSLLPDDSEAAVREVFDKIELSIGQWVKGQFILMFVIGLLSYIGLVILEVDYPLALALVAGLLEVVPFFGPVLAGAFASIVGFSMSPIKGLGVIVLYIIIQQLENNLLVPKVMQQVSGFSPLIIMLAIMVGAHFFGFTGVVLAVPTTMIIAIIVRKVLQYSNSAGN